ncbi:MAG: VTT domain-containing protein [Thermoleophilia bacterium]|nr:VTT domain-containing protein [Thermoleophilia bacterium]
MLVPFRFREGIAAAAIASQVVLDDERPTRRRGRALASAATIAVVLLAAYATWRWLEATGGSVALLERFGPLAPLVSIPVHVLLSATPFPSELIGVANGSVYGLWVGALCSWIGWWCGAALEYGLVRLGARQAQWVDAVGHLPRWLRRFPVGHPVFLIVGRQLPFGFHTVNVLAGLAGVSGRRQVICAAISNVPYAFFSAALGAGLIAAR